MQKAEDQLGSGEEAEEGEDLCDCEFSLAYGAKILLNNAKLHLKRGKLYGLCGPNGAGKVCHFTNSSIPAHIIVCSWLPSGLLLLHSALAQCNTVQSTSTDPVQSSAYRLPQQQLYTPSASFGAFDTPCLTRALTTLCLAVHAHARHLQRPGRWLPPARGAAHCVRGARHRRL